MRHSHIALTRLYGLVKVNPVLDGFGGFIKATDRQGFHIACVEMKKLQQHIVQYTHLQKF